MPTSEGHQIQYSGGLHSFTTDTIFMAIISLNSHIVSKIPAAINDFLNNKINLEELWIRTKLPDSVIESSQTAEDYYETWLNIEVIYIMNQTSSELSEDDATILLQTIVSLQGLIEKLIQELKPSDYQN